MSMAAQFITFCTFHSAPIRMASSVQTWARDCYTKQTLFGVKSSNRTYVHRMVTFDSVEVEDIKEFEDILSNGKVTLSQAKREQIRIR